MLVEPTVGFGERRMIRALVAIMARLPKTSPY